MLIARQEGDDYPGKCPYHRNCLEGLAAGAAIMERFGRPAAELADRAEVWELVSDYLAQAVANYILILSPQKVILGGGVMHQEQMFPLVRKKVQEKLNSYLHSDTLLEHIKDYIVPPALGDNAGITGALLLGFGELENLAAQQ